ncbi:MAG: hypothetical protein Q4E24_01300 [bacterium]|nr:hypothetical protein [bacterium]
MFYNISKTLESLPYIAYGLLGAVWMILEIKNFREQLSEGPVTEPGRGGFILPPGEGYEYYVNSNSICYILQKARKKFKIYVIQGDSPAVKLKRDKYGTYFNARCQDAGAAEKIVDAAYGM